MSSTLDSALVDGATLDRMEEYNELLRRQKELEAEAKQYARDYKELAFAKAGYDKDGSEATYGSVERQEWDACDKFLSSLLHDIIFKLQTVQDSIKRVKKEAYKLCPMLGEDPEPQTRHQESDFEHRFAEADTTGTIRIVGFRRAINH